MAVTNTTSNSKDLAFAYFDSAMKTERFGEAKRFTLVFAGTCASCSLKAINPLKLSETLGPSHLLILVYSSPLRAIRQEFKKGDIGKSTIIVADPDNVLTSSLNAFFPYRHVSGDIEGISLIVTKLQDRNEPESECYK